MNIYFAHGDEAHEVVSETTAHADSSSARNIIIGVVAVLLVTALVVYLAKRPRATSKSDSQDKDEE